MPPTPYIVGVVPARKGSRGILDKNVQPLAGRPLVAHTLMAARQATRLDAVFCTTDCPKVRRIAESHGVEVVGRPPRLADDQASMRDVLADLHTTLLSQAGALPQGRPVWYAVLYPTCPLRTAQHIDDCVEFALTGAPFDSVVSVCQTKSAPPSGFTLDGDGAVVFVDEEEREYYQRQQQTPKYRLNGAIWLLDSDRFDRMNLNMIGRRTLAFVMDEPSSVDIDTLVDLKLAEVLMETAGRPEMVVPV